MSDITSLLINHSIVRIQGHTGRISPVIWSHNDYGFHSLSTATLWSLQGVNMCTSYGPLPLEAVSIVYVPLATVAFNYTWWPFYPLGHKVPLLMSFKSDSFVLFFLCKTLKKKKFLRLKFSEGLCWSRKAAWQPKWRVILKWRNANEKW